MIGALLLGAAFADELTSGERVLWEGQPDPRRWLTAQDWFLIPFSLMWGGFAIFWEFGVLSSTSARSSVIAPIWGIPFALIGIYLIFGRLVVRHRIRAATRYAVTDRRVIEVTQSIGGRRRVNTVWLASYPPVEKRVDGNGRGTVLVGQFGMGRSFNMDPSWPGAGRVTSGGIVLADIEGATQVAALITNRLSQLRAQ